MEGSGCPKIRDFFLWSPGKKDYALGFLLGFPLHMATEECT